MIKTNFIDFKTTLKKGNQSVFCFGFTFLIKISFAHIPIIFSPSFFSIFVMCLIFRLFLARNHFKKFKNIIFRLNSTKAFDWFITCHILMRKKIYSLFTIRGGPLLKKKSKIFIVQIWKFIHHQYILNFLKNWINM